MDNKDKIILDLCGGTGSWSKPYKEAGYDVRLITLPDNNVLEYTPPKNVYGILAAPPCTEFSLAKGNLPRNFKEAMRTMEACLNIKSKAEDAWVDMKLLKYYDNPQFKVSGKHNALMVFEEEELAGLVLPVRMPELV